METMLTKPELARLLRCSTRTIDRRVADGRDVPPSIKVGNHRRWTQGQYNKWLRELTEGERAQVTEPTA